MTDPADPSKCTDLDECAVNNGECQHNCFNSEGSYSCSCRPGYRVLPVNPTRCEDVDECAEADRGGCSHQCVNTVGGHECKCPPGFLLRQPANKQCKAVDKKKVPCESVPRPNHGFMRCTKRKVSHCEGISTGHKNARISSSSRQASRNEVNLAIIIFCTVCPRQRLW